MNQPERKIQNTNQKADLITRVQLAWKLLLGKPVMYRVGIFNADIFYPEPINVRQCHISFSCFRPVGNDGVPVDVKLPGIQTNHEETGG